MALIFIAKTDKYKLRTTKFFFLQFLLVKISKLEDRKKF